jgi:hypothetical protein
MLSRLVFYPQRPTAHTPLQQSMAREQVAFVAKQQRLVPNCVTHMCVWDVGQSLTSLQEQ